MMLVSVGRNMWLCHNTTAVLKGKVGFFQSVWICGLGYDPKGQEIGLISGMQDYFFSYLYRRLWNPYSLPYSGYCSCFPSYSDRKLEANKLHSVP